MLIGFMYLISSYMTNKHSHCNRALSFTRHLHLQSSETGSILLYPFYRKENRLKETMTYPLSQKISKPSYPNS